MVWGTYNGPLTAGRARGNELNATLALNLAELDVGGLVSAARPLL